MTVWEHLVANSTLAEGDGDAWDHLTHPSGTGGSGDIIINSELVKVEEEAPIRIIEYSEKVGIIEVEEIVVTDYDPTDEINEEKDDVNVVC